MSQLHKLFKELRKLSEDERELLQEAIRESFNVERTCKNLGIKYTDKMCVNWLNNTANYRAIKTSAPVQTASPNTSPDPTTEKIKKIVLGDNLDIIEEAAKKKGLI